MAHGIEPRPLPVVDGDRDPLAGHRALDKVPAHDVLQDTFTGVVRLDHVSVVKVDAQGIILVLTHSDNVIHIDQVRLNFYKSAHFCTPIQKF